MTIKNTIDSYRKRRNQLNPVWIMIGVLLLVVIGIVLIVVFLSGGNAKGGWNPFASKTPTPTETFTPTDTPIPTDTPTITSTPTETFTATPSAPYLYTVQQGDYLYKIVQDHNLGDNGIVLILLLNPYNPTDTTNPGIDPSAQSIQVGQKIWLPNPGMPMPSATALPTGLGPGARVNYFIMPGDSLASIANKLRSTVAAIVAANPKVLTSGATTTLYPGWILVVPIDLVTAVPPTHTVSPTPTATVAGPTLTPTATP